MIIATFSWLKSERLWRYAIYILFSFGFLGGVLLGSLLIFPRGHLPQNKGKTVREGKEVIPEQNNYDSIGKGALSLKGNAGSRFLPLVVDEVQYLGFQNLPASSEQGKMLVRFKSTGEEKVIPQGVPFFLKVENGAGSHPTIVGFSEGEAELRLTSIELSGEKAYINVEYIGQEGEGGESGGQVVLEKGGTLDQSASYFQTLKEAKWWGVDELFRHCGGPQYKELKDKSKLEFCSNEAAYICFAGVGDTFVWEGGRWTAGVLKEGSCKPLFSVRSITQGKMEIEGWDETGFNSFRLVLTPEYRAEKMVSLDHLPTSIRIRNGSQISCILNKSRILLNEGEWLVKLPKGWRILKQADEIEDCIHHKLRGPLFIFEKLEKEHGKLIVKGHLFDEMRTNKQTMNIPIVSEQKKAPKKSKSKKIVR